MLCVCCYLFIPIIEMSFISFQAHTDPPPPSPPPLMAAVALLSERIRLHKKHELLACPLSHGIHSCQPRALEPWACTQIRCGFLFLQLSHKDSLTQKNGRRKMGMKVRIKKVRATLAEAQWAHWPKIQSWTSTTYCIIDRLSGCRRSTRLLQIEKREDDGEAYCVLNETKTTHEREE